MKAIELFLRINNKNVIGIFLGGSRLYGTNTEESDYDFLIILENESLKNINITFENKINAITMKEEELLFALYEHQLPVIEYMLSNDIYIAEKFFEKHQQIIEYIKKINSLDRLLLENIANSQSVRLRSLKQAYSENHKKGFAKNYTHLKRVNDILYNLSKGNTIFNYLKKE